MKKFLRGVMAAIGCAIGFPIAILTTVLVSIGSFFTVLKYGGSFKDAMKTGGWAFACMSSCLTMLYNRLIEWVKTAKFHEVTESEMEEVFEKYLGA